MRRRIIFVDGPSRDLRDLASTLAGRDPRWDTRVLESGRAALESIAPQPCDALIVDLHLNDMPGAELARQTLAHLPQIHRVLMADLGDPAALFGCVGSVHQFLTKPCEAQRLETVLDRAFAFQVWLPNQAVRSLIGHIPNVPTATTHYQAVVHELRLETPSIERVASFIALDPAMAAKILQLANSAAYGPALDEADPITATRELGLTNTRGALLLGHSYSDFTEAAETGFSPELLQQHAHRTSQLARVIAEAEHVGHRQVQQAATAGLLHDLGKVALAVNLPKQYSQSQALARTGQLTDWEAEQEVFGASHAEVAACLLALWNLPPAVIEAVAMHHLPTRFLTQSFSLLTAVHVANAFDHVDSLEAARDRLDLAYLKELHLDHRLPAWWALCQAERQSLNTSHTPGHTAHG
jgi:HD-like signal output (HDOD) protein/ActR/RegA family two-component response regulator